MTEPLQLKKGHIIGFGNEKYVGGTRRDTLSAEVVEKMEGKGLNLESHKIVKAKKKPVPVVEQVVEPVEAVAKVAAVKKTTKVKKVKEIKKDDVESSKSE